MKSVLKNNFSFPESLLAKARLFPDGHYVECNDLAFELNGLGKKVLKTMVVEIGGKDYSVGYFGDGDDHFVLISADEEPVDLGSHESLVADAPLVRAFAGVFGSSMSMLELVLACRSAKAGQILSTNELGIRKIALEIRTWTKRATWVVQNQIDAISLAPVNWASKSL